MIPRAHFQLCHFCGCELDTRPKNKTHTNRLKQGWAPIRSDGGTNALRMAVNLDLYACKMCLDLQARGQVRFQPDLFGSTVSTEAG